MLMTKFEIIADTKWRKLSRSSMKSWAIGRLVTQQNRCCAICGKPIDMTLTGVRADMVVDHCHETGLIRGILHKSCNSAEGKVVNAAGRWGAKSTKYEDVIPFLKQLIQYLEDAYTNPSGVIYPDHKTQEQKDELTKVRRRKADAMRRAKARVAKQDQEQV